MKNIKTTSWLTDKFTQAEITEMKIRATIAAEIGFKRIELELNQKEFAKKMGVSQSMVSKWESGDYNFTIKSLAEIATKLEIEMVSPFPVKEYNFVHELAHMDISYNYAIASLLDYTEQTNRVFAFKKHNDSRNSKGNIDFKPDKLQKKAV